MTKNEKLQIQHNCQNCRFAKTNPSSQSIAFSEKIKLENWFVFLSSSKLQTQVKTQRNVCAQSLQLHSYRSEISLFGAFLIPWCQTQSTFLSDVRSF